MKMNLKRFLGVLSVIFLVLISGYSCKQKKETETTKKAAVSIPENDGFEKIFDGKTLTNWKGDTTYWRVENGAIVGEVTPETLLKTNTFLIWEGGKPEDFELKLDFKIAVSGNSGVNYRSELLDTIPFALRGYQADIDGKNSYTGQNYEERKRATLAYRGEKVIINTQDNADKPGSLRANVAKNCWQSREVVSSLGESDALKAKIKSEDWNSLHLIIKGNSLKHYVNGILMSEVTDMDTINRKLGGYLGLQVHVGPPMKVAYKNIEMKQL